MSLYELTIFLWRNKKVRNTEKGSRIFLCSLLKNISKEIKKGFIRREVSDVGTMDGMLPHSQLETQINRVWSWLYIFSGYSALPPNIKMSLWHYEQLQNLLSSPSGDFFQCWAGTWYFPTEKYRRRKYNITSSQAMIKEKVRCKLLTGVLLWFGSSLATSRSWIFSLYTSK